MAPSSIVSGRRKRLTLINPATDLFRRRFRRSQHVAISYCWADWRSEENAGHDLHHWPELRKRLMKIVGPDASDFMKLRNGGETCCWIDCKCINQSSAADKRYWVPRMNEIYYQARCTVLLLRNIELNPVRQVLAACRNYDSARMCLKVGAGVTIPILKPELEAACLAALKAISEGPWRSRAWVFQEYLLSQAYIFSGEDGVDVGFGDIITLSGLFRSIFPDQEWLNDLYDWFSRIVVLHRQWPWREYGDSNILQIAGSLSATLPCDKYYSLLGVLRLKEELEYVESHTESEALQAVILALTRAGRLSWLYAVPPAIQPRVFVLESRGGAYLEHRYVQRRSLVCRPTTSQSSIGFTCVDLGNIVRTFELEGALYELIQYADGNLDYQRAMPDHLTALPSLLLPFCQQLVDSSTDQNPASGLICRGAGLPEGSSLAAILNKMLRVQDFQTMKERKASLGGK